MKYWYWAFPFRKGLLQNTILNLNAIALIKIESNNCYDSKYNIYLFNLRLCGCSDAQDGISAYDHPFLTPHYWIYYIIHNKIPRDMIVNILHVRIMHKVNVLVIFWWTIWNGRRRRQPLWCSFKKHTIVQRTKFSST